MALPSTYADRNCSLARALEVVGERWTLLIVRDAVFGISRFGDFATQLGIPRAVLTSRLKALVREGVFRREEDESGNVDYRLTDKGLGLWPVLRLMMDWGDEHYSPGGARRVFRHDQDGGLVDHDGRCAVCGSVVAVPEVRIEPGPGFDASVSGGDAVSAAVNGSRMLLEPVVVGKAGKG